MLAPIGATLAAWLVLGALAEIAGRIRLGRADAARDAAPRLEPAARRLGQGARPCRLRRHDLRHRRDHRLGGRGHPRRPARRRGSPIAGYELRFDGVERQPRRELRHRRATVTILRDGRAVGTLHPEKRLYDVQAMATTEAGIDRGLRRDLYVALGDPQPDGAWALRTYLKPFANWIWLGALIMAVGGVVSLTDRRYRVGAPARRAAPSAAVPAE